MRKGNVSTSEKVYIKFHIRKCNSDSPPLLVYLTGAESHKKPFLLSTLQRKISIALYGQQWMQEKKLTRIQTPLKSQRQWSSYQRAPVSARFWTAIDTLERKTSETKKHKQVLDEKLSEKIDL